MEAQAARDLQEMFRSFAGSPEYWQARWKGNLGSPRDICGSPREGGSSVGPGRF